MPQQNGSAPRIRESSAAALVRFTGLGIICFNPADQRGEIGIIRDNEHVLTINIKRPVYQDGTNTDALTYREVVSYQNLPHRDVRIEIKANGALVAGYEIYQNGDFDRLDSGDANDFRWFVSMSNLHGAGTLTASSQQPYPLTKVFIKNGLFYAHRLNEKLVFEKVETDANGVEGPSEDFGSVAETLGVKIEGDDVSFTVRIGEQETTHTLPFVNGLPYIIEFKNMNLNENAVASDMPDYYKYITSFSGNQFRLKPVVEDELIGVIQQDDELPEVVTADSVNQVDFCHPVVFPWTTIDQL